MTTGSFCALLLADGEAMLASPPAGLTSAAELDARGAGGESCCVDVGALVALTDSLAAVSPCPADKKWSSSLFASGDCPEEEAEEDEDAPVAAAAAAAAELVEGPEVIE